MAATGEPFWLHVIRKLLWRAGYNVLRLTPAERSGAAAIATTETYRENPEIGAVNLPEKLKRQAAGGPFEWPNIVNLNRAVALRIGDAKSIVELGAGTGAFAIAAAENPDRKIVCSEFDAEAHRWAAQNRPRPNVCYVNGPVSAADGPFDLLVSIEVIEHVSDFAGFLRTCAELAPRALITTPNRRRYAEADHAGPPEYHQHVREWSAGEFYWVLRGFYHDVTLYGLLNDQSPESALIDVDSRRTPMIADCRRPLRWWSSS